VVVRWQTATVPFDATASDAAVLLALTTVVAYLIMRPTIMTPPRLSGSRNGRAGQRGRRPSRKGRRIGPPAPGLDDYGLLRTLALVERLDTGQSVRALLSAGGVRATVATGSDGLVRVLVFPDEYDRARRMVSWVL
jgi:hypothetical protein